MATVVIAAAGARIEQICVDELGRDDLATELVVSWSHLGDPFTQPNVRFLTACLDSNRIHEADASAVSAVIRSLLMGVEASPSDDFHSNALRAAAAAAHDNGLFPLLGQILRIADQLSHTIGYEALFTFYKSQMPMVRQSPEVFDQLRSEYSDKCRATKRSDPAVAEIERINRWLNQQRSEGTSSTRHPTVLGQAARAADSGDLESAAQYYSLAVAEADTPDQAALFRLVAEYSKLKSGQFNNPSDFIQSMARLTNDHVAKAKPLIPVDSFILEHTSAAKRTGHADRDRSIAAVASDFAGDVRLGVALDHRFASLSTATKALTDLTVVDALQRDPEILDVEDVRIAMPGTGVVWVTLSHEFEPGRPEVALKSILDVTTLAVSTSNCMFEETILSEEQVRQIEQMTGSGSEDIDDAELTWLSDCLFRRIASDSAIGALYVIPDQPSWELPWSRLVPETIEEFAVAPSVASVLRLSPPQSCRPPRIVGIFNEELPGAHREVAALSELDMAGLVKFEQVRDFSELAARLHRRCDDMLVISAHGTRSDGFEFQIDIGSESVPLSALLELPIPPTVSLGCCWSARSPQSSSTVVASLACIVAGASLVIGGLWDLDDTASADLLSAAFTKFAAGAKLPVALRRAFLELPLPAKPSAGGVCLFGRL